VIFALFLVGGAFLVLGFVLFDKVLKFQYHNYRTEWENAGKVRGFFFYSIRIIVVRRFASTQRSTFVVDFR
jgi:hypothetical protein